MGIVNENMIADYVILDARMIKNLPRKIAAVPAWMRWHTASSALPATRPTPSAICNALEGLD